MAVRQYIGARYVLKFAGDWDNANDYEALTVVKYNAFTYVSKQAVPAGVAINNTDFWLEWADPNAQMAELRMIIGNQFDLDNTISDFYSTADAAFTDIYAQLGSGFDSVNTVAKAISDEETARIAADDLRAIEFDTVADMKASTELKTGMFAHTSGYHAAGDGGAAYYKISDTGTANEMDVIACGSLFAHLIVDKETACPEMFGAYGDNTYDDSQAINKCLEIAKNCILKNVYLIDSPIVLGNDLQTFDNQGTINYTGNSYALTMQATTGLIQNKSINLGTISAESGSCMLLESNGNWIQYINIDFKSLKSANHCIHLKIEDNWINEVRFVNGRFTTGTYGVYIENNTNTDKGNFVFDKVGFEGVTNGVYLDGAITGVIFSQCRMRETTVNVINSSNDATVKSSAIWFGELALTYVPNITTELYIYGNIYERESLVRFGADAKVVNGFCYTTRRRKSQTYLSAWTTQNIYYIDDNTKIIRAIPDNNKLYLVRIPSVDTSKTLQIEKNFLGDSNFTNELYVYVPTITAQLTISVDTFNYNISAAGCYKVEYIYNYGICITKCEMTI